MSVRTIGQIAAAALLLGIVALLVISFRASGTAEEEPIDGSLPPDVGTTDSAGGMDIVELGTQSVWQRRDPDTGRIEYRLEWDALDPQPGGRFVVENPSAVIYADTVRAVISAVRGRLLWPDQNDRVPESGDLYEGVTITIFPQRVEPGLEDEADEPLATLTTSSITFETARGLIDSRDRVEITGQGVGFVGRGLAVRISQTRKRLQSLLIDRGERLTIRPDELADLDDSTQADSSESSDAPNSTSSDPADLTAQLYEVLVRGGARLDYGPRSAIAEEMVLWARLRGGKLDRDAVTPFRLAGESSPIDPEADRGTASTESAASGGLGEELNLVWDGPLEVRPIDTDIDEASRDDLAVRFRTPSQFRPVELRDAASGLSITAGEVFYGLGSGRLDITPRDDEPILLAAQDRYEGSFDAPLTGALADGILVTRGGGRISTAEDAPDPARARWAGSADIAFDAKRNGELTFASLSLADDVEIDASTEGSPIEARGDSVRVRADDAGRVSAATLAGSASIVTQGEQGEQTVTSDQLAVIFDPGAERLKPVAASGEGNVRARSAQGELDAQRVDLRLVENDEGAIEVRSIDATDGVRAFLAEEGVRITGDVMRADARRETLQVIGEPGRIEAETDAGSRMVSGENIVIANRSREFIVYGGGEASATQTATADRPEESVDLAWSGSLIVRDYEGTAEVIGDASVLAERDGLERHAAEGDRIVVRFTPFREPATDGTDAEAADRPREIISARIDGPFDGAGADSWAKLESRFFAEDQAVDGEPTIIALRGGEVVANNERGTLRVDGPGLLLVNDQRADAQDADADAETRGASVFEWSNDLDVQREEGLALMRGEVRVRHLAEESRTLTQIRASELAVRFDEPGQSGDEQNDLGEVVIRSIEASGGVVLRHDTLEVRSEVLEYDEQTAKAIARSPSGGQVTLYDEREQRTVNASRVEIDLRTSQWRATDAAGRLVR